MTTTPQRVTDRSLDHLRQPSLGAVAEVKCRQRVRGRGGKRTRTGENPRTPEIECESCCQGRDRDFDCSDGLGPTQIKEMSSQGKVSWYGWQINGKGKLLEKSNGLRRWMTWVRQRLWNQIYSLPGARNLTFSVLVSITFNWIFSDDWKRYITKYM